MAGGLVANDGSVAVKEEVTEGTYVAESADTDFVETLEEGLEFVPARELLERQNRTGTVETVAARVGQKSMAGTIPVEWKAASSVGDAPETNPLWKSLLGGRRQLTSAVTSGTTHTTTRIFLSAVDAAKFKVGDIIKVKESGAHHVSPVVEVVDSGGGEYIDVLVPFAGGFTDAVEIEKFTTYFPDSGNAPTLSITNYLGGEVREKAIGMRSVSAEITNFNTGQLGNVPFSVEGLTFDREVGTPLFTPAFDTSLPPVMLEACVFKDGVQIDINALTLSITNTLGFLTSTKSPNGKISSRIVNLAVAGTLNPYMEDDDVDTFDLFNDNTGFSIFGFAQNPDAVAGEQASTVAFYVPNCRMPELATGVEDGILTDAISFSGHRTLGNDSVFIGMI